MNYNLDKYIIDDRIFSTKFSCDLEVCKGACCVIKGTIGAPILKSEISQIEEVIPVVKQYLSDINIDIIENEGFYEKYDNEHSLQNVNDNDCVFSFYENGISKCSFQKAYFDKKISFMKPISCYLFPIRIYGNNRRVIRYEHFHECDSALDKGKKMDISVFEFLKDPLIKEYGEEFYHLLKQTYT